MSDAFIPLELGKFQLCCVPGCSGDAIGEHKKKISTGTVYMGYCYRRGHNTQVKNICASTDTIKQDMENSFFQPNGACRKCKISVFLKNPVKPVLEEDIVTKKKALQMAKSFKWVYNYRKWKDLRGVLVPIHTLSDEEILSAIHWIRVTNFERMSKKLEWTKWVKSIAITSMVEYPEDSLIVSSNAAHNKLEEFKSVVIKRNLM